MARASALLFVLASCGGLSAPMHASSTASCSDVLVHEAAIRSDPRYPHESAQDRAAYELDVADCDLQSGKAQAALDLADGWHDAVAVRRDKVRVRALAMLNRADDLREALGTLISETDLTQEYFVDTAELGPFEATDWLVPMAMQVWERHSGPLALRQFAGALVHNARGRLVDLALVSADPGRAPGEWAAWAGKLHDARIDRAGNRTLLEAEGIDFHDEVTEQKVLTSVEGRHGFGRIELTPNYTTETEHHETASATGKPFFVRVSHVDERLVRLGMFTAFGHYAGRDGGTGAPILDALVVIERPSN